MKKTMAAGSARLGSAVLDACDEHGPGGARTHTTREEKRSRLMLLLALALSLLCLTRHATARSSAGLQLQQPAGQEGEEEEQHQGLRAVDRGLQSFPSVTNSTILFLHVFKCAGTSLREVLINWAKSEGWSGAIVEYCRKKTFTNSGRICLNSRNELVDPLREKWLVKGSKLLAGHFLWDFRHEVTPPYLMVTTLRNPLELFVSSQQFMHKEETRTLEDSVAFVSESMRSRLKWQDPTDLAFIRRFLDTESANSYDPKVVYTKEETLAMAQTAVDNLNTFFVVGVVEQYQGFIEVLKRSLDPSEEHPSLWREAVGVKDNGSPVRSGNVLSHIDPDLVREFNATSLGLQWQVYDVALQLWDRRCREVLPVEDHPALCAVPARR